VLVFHQFCETPRRKFIIEPRERYEYDSLRTSLTFGKMCFTGEGLEQQNYLDVRMQGKNAEGDIFLYKAA
jgi:hypothetical protein